MSIKERIEYADDLPYFKTSSSSPDTWIDRTIKLITDSGGSLLSSAIGTDHRTGRTAFLLIFNLEGDNYRISFPVMPVKKESDAKAAKVQAATILYHDIKSRLISTKILGARSVFFGYLLLEDGRTPAELENPNLLNTDRLFKLSPGENPEIIEGEFNNEH